MPIDFKKPAPVSVEGAVDRIFSNLDEQELEFAKKNGLAHLHHTFGMAMRNHWQLWEQTSPIVKEVKKRFALFGHGDDCSGLILAGVDAVIAGRDLREALNKKAQEFFKHWHGIGLNPVTGKKLGKFSAKFSRNLLTPQPEV